MTYAQFIAIHPSLDFDTLVYLFITENNIIRVLSLYENIDKDHYTYVKLLYVTVYEKIGREPYLRWEITKILVYGFIYSIFLGFIYGHLPLAEANDLAWFDTMSFHILEFLSLGMDQILLHETIYKELIQIFSNHILLNLANEYEFLLVLHDLLLKYSL